ncbi:hypothetical protein NADFUDRAFT_82762 [Nadsonia fulvescens var. elongata DSM 6958]|uniref:Jacalin-type lectin domain-containing protein n=1 Tax=Nadsonia fulvescens var. elongata DSM 6958 TaxID=857566 RepID=A0A1E3PKH4_9ASCO|nr:hypothetical protein NADFUDRAFT_82762 [Nadsonia fulvescens var. elongata DSM 6958]
MLHGTAGNVDFPTNSNVIIHHHLDSFPEQKFPVSQNYFKALVHLQPGPNEIIVDYEIPDTKMIAKSTINIVYIPLLQNEPLQLALILGKDSPGTFDSLDYKKDREGNGLELAIKKLRLAGYMMSAFTAEQMARNGFGPRSFRLEESWELDTISNQESTQRSTARVHVIRCDKTVAELRDPDLAQQNPEAKKANDLFNIAAEAISNHGEIFSNGKQQHVACLFLDAHWDAQQNLLLAHAALGGYANNFRLAIFGSHSLFSWPSCIEEIPSCFMDTTLTDTSKVCNDSNQSGTAWEALNIGQGAFQHEIGHLLGCPHQPSGIMLRDYTVWNRSFMPMEPEFCTRTGQPGLSLCLPKDECGWHRLDTIRFRYSSVFRTPDEPIISGTKPILFSLENGIAARCSSGIYMVEIEIEDSGKVGWIEYSETPTEIFLDRDVLFSHISEENRDTGKKIRIGVFGKGGEEEGIADFMAFNDSNRVSTPMRSSGSAFKSPKVGRDVDANTTVFFADKGPIASVIIHSGLAVDGVELTFRNTNETCLFGKRGGSPTALTFENDEYLLGFAVKAGYWVDAIQVITNKRKGPMCGGDGGGLHELIPPYGFTPVGLFGTIESWLFTFGIIYQAL